jgi:hypothetical protein
MKYFQKKLLEEVLLRYKKYFCMIFFCIFLVVVVLGILHFALTCWTSYKYKDINLVTIREIDTSDFNSKCFMVAIISKQKFFSKMCLSSSANNQRIPLPLLESKHYFFDDTWYTHFYIRAFPDGKISIVPSIITKPDKYFSVSIYQQNNVVNWSIPSFVVGNYRKYRKIPAGKKLITTVIKGVQGDVIHRLEWTMDEETTW